MPMQFQKDLESLCLKLLITAQVPNYQQKSAQIFGKSQNSPLKPSGHLKLLGLLKTRGFWGPCRIYSVDPNK